MQARRLSDEEWAEWLKHPVTLVFREYLRLKREDLKESWATNSYTADVAFGTAVMNAKAVGGCELIRGLLELDVVEVNGVISDE